MNADIGKLRKMRGDARDIFLTSLDRVRPKDLIQKSITLNGNTLVVPDREYDLSAYENIYVVGAGKAGAGMAAALERILGDRITGGAVTVKYGYRDGTRKIAITEAGHPIPDQASVEGTRNIMELLKAGGENDLAICLISGGGSALLCAPAEGISLTDKQQTTSVLLKCGADITELNAIRKHLSSVKGGQLARLAYPSEILTLILSDVIGDPLDSIASGPTSPDDSTFQTCLDIVKKYNIENNLPEAVVNRLEKGNSGSIPETPGSDDPAFDNTNNVIIGNNIIAVNAAGEKAAELGYNTYIVDHPVRGDTRDAVRDHCGLIRQVLETGRPVEPPACIVSGGETTVEVRGNGMGGRNQEFVLAACMVIRGMENIVVLSGGTDGTDGPTDAAGGIVDNTTFDRAVKIGIVPREYLDNNDSYNFLKATGDLLITGPTRTNVMDIHIIIIDA